MLKQWIPAALALTGLAFALPAHAGKTLDAVKARGQVVCGVNTSGPGFSAADSQGSWTGLDVDFCRAVAAAVLKDAEQGQVRAAQFAAALRRRCRRARSTCCRATAPGR